MSSMELCPLQYYDKYVARTKRCVPDKFEELCLKHLAVLLDLSEEKMHLLLPGHKAHKKKTLRLSSVGMFKRKDLSQGLFGLPLTDEGLDLMMPLIEFLNRETNVTKEGLFHKPGNMSKMSTLRELLIDYGPEVNIDPEVFSAHDVASVLKEFLRELPEPLLTERHLEAHMHILALGQHAKTPGEKIASSSRKLSALQLLMLLLPSPAHILTMHLVTLLKKTADSPVSRLTPVTLGNLFAPVFFSKRKVQDLLGQICKTAPAASFLIDNAHELFQAPKELVIELTNFWKSSKQSFLRMESSQMQISLSGQALCPDVAYDDSHMSRCDVSARNVTAELPSKLVRVQTDSGKKRKSVDGTEFCAHLRRCRRSIGSTVRKSLPYLQWTRKRQEDSPRSISSSVLRSDTQAVTLEETYQTECSPEAPEARHPLQLQKLGQKRRYSSGVFPTVSSYCSSNPLVKQKCQETAARDITMSGNQKYLKHDDCEVQLPAKKNPTKVVSDFDDNKTHRVSTSSLDDIIDRVIESLKSEGPRIYNTENTSTTNHWSYIPPDSKVWDLYHQRKLAGIQIGEGQPFDFMKYTQSMTGSIKPTPATDKHQQTSRKPQTEVLEPSTDGVVGANFHETSV